MSVTHSAKSILLLLPHACRERSAGSFPGVRSQALGGEKRGQRLGQEGPGAPGAAPTSRWPTLRPRTRRLRARLRAVLWSCPASAGLLGPVDFIRLRSFFEGSFREPRINVLASCTRVESLVELFSISNARLITVCTCNAVLSEADICLASS